MMDTEIATVQIINTGTHRQWFTAKNNNVAPLYQMIAGATLD